MAITRHSANRQDKPLYFREKIMHPVGAGMPGAQVPGSVAPAYYRFQESSAGYDLSLSDGANQWLIRPPTEVDGSYKSFDMAFLAQGLTASQMRTKNVSAMIAQDYHRFYDLLGDIFRSGFNLEISTEQILNGFCKRLLSAIDPLKWSSIICLSDFKKPQRTAHDDMTSPSRVDKKNQQAAPVTWEMLMDRAAIYDLMQAETPKVLRPLRDHIREAAVLPVRLEHQNALWVLGSGISGYLDRLGLKHLLMVPRLLELMVSAKEQAQRDPLTGLPNRAYLRPRLTEAKARSHRHGTLFALGVLDLDGFKEVNDTFGHKAGDWVLQETVIRLKKVLRSSDALIRLGGDEFVLLFEDLDNDEALYLILDRIQNVIGKPYRYHEAEMRIAASLGITVYPLDDASDDSLIQHADQALYVAKASKVTRERFFTLYNARNGRTAS